MMHAVAYLLPPTAPLAPQSTPVDQQGRLDWLRRIERRCRALPGDDLFRACATLGADCPQAADRYAKALFQVLPGSLGGARVRFYQVGAEERSFDEDWLLGLLSAAERGDEASLTFLLARRLPHHTRRQVAFLVNNLARTLDIAA